MIAMMALLLSAWEPDMSKVDVDHLIKPSLHEIYLVDDAFKRWKEKSGDDGSNRFPIIMGFPDEICIQLRFSTDSLGREPIYCYKRDIAVGNEQKKIVLTRKYDNGD